MSFGELLFGKKGPKTEKGIHRKLWTGDGRKKSPVEEIFNDIDSIFDVKKKKSSKKKSSKKKTSRK